MTAVSPQHGGLDAPSPAASGALLSRESSTQKVVAHETWLRTIPPPIPLLNEPKSPGKESQAWRQAGRCKALRSLRAAGEGRNQKGSEGDWRGGGGWG